MGVPRTSELETGHGGNGRRRPKAECATTHNQRSFARYAGRLALAYSRAAVGLSEHGA